MSALVPSRKVQRLVVFAMLWLIAAAAVWFVPWGGTAAQAQSQSSAYQPFACAQSGGGNRRQTVPLANANVNGTTSGVFYPCISGVPWRFQAGDLSNFNNNSADGIDIAYVNGVYSKTNPTIYWASSGSSGLYGVAFKDLQICTGSNTPASGCTLSASNTDSATNNDVALYADSSGTASPKPKTNYVLRIAPNGPITIGGNGVITDLLATGGSRFSVNMGDVLAGSIGCTAAGGGVIGGTFGVGAHTCQGITVSALNSLSWLTGVASYHIRELDLTFYYLATHAGSTADPYTQPPVDSSGNPLDSIQLPNTRITVCPSTAACNPTP
jgi:hypothetical protein